MKKFLTIFGSFIIFFFTIATFFKLMHWPGSAVIMTLMLLLFAVFFIPLFFIQRMIEDKSGLSIVTNIFGLFSTSLMFMGVLFKMMHWPGASIMLVLGILFFIFPTLILYVIYQFKHKQRKFSEFWKFVFLAVLAGVFILFWGVSVSRNILTSFLNIEDVTICTNKNLEEYNAFVLKQIGSADSTNTAVIESSRMIHAETKEMVVYIESIKEEMISRIELNPQAQKDHWQIIAIDNYDAPTYYLGDYESKKGKELLNKIKAFNVEMTKQMKVISGDSENGNFGIDISVKPQMTSGYDMQWNEAMFYNQTVAGTMAILSSLQNQALNAEFKCLSTISLNVPRK
jgi:hypothetical protein